MERIHISNFQSHKSTDLALAPAINTLEGVSDSGKSAALRAILWAVTNKPDGTTFASAWAKTKTGKIKEPVEVSIDNITRIRTDTFNGYIVHNAEGVDKYEALKGSVPSDISNLLNIGDVNIQRQMDPPFLLSDTPGDSARYVNSLVGLDDIDTYLRTLKGLAREVSGALKTEEARAKELESALHRYDWVIQASDMVAALDEAVAVVTTIESSLECLHPLAELAGLETMQKRNTLDQANALIESYHGSDSLSAEINLLDDLFKATLALDSKNADLQTVTIILEGAIACAEDILVLQNDAAILDEYCGILDKEGALNNALAELIDFLSGAVCPVCGKPLNDV